MSCLVSLQRKIDQNFCFSVYYCIYLFLGLLFCLTPSGEFPLLAAVLAVVLPSDVIIFWRQKAHEEPTARIAGPSGKGLLSATFGF